MRAVALAVALAALGCGGRSASHRDESGVRAGGGGAGVASAAGGTGGGSAETGGTSSMQPPPPICATLEAIGQRRFEGFVFAVDRSAGMATSWDVVEKELLELFRSPVAADMSIGLRFFPDSQPGAGCDSTLCTRDACAALLVPVAPLTADPAPADPQQSALELALAENTITKEGPVPGVALYGALTAAAYATTPEQPTSAVLVTAGEADTCGFDRQTVADAYEKIGYRTFVVAPASLSDFSELDAIAAAGGTDKTIRIGPPDGESLADALTPLRAGDYSCSIPIDVPVDVALKFDAAVMQVALDDAAPVSIPMVTGEADCGNDFGWYYDDPGAPAVIVFCPALCEAVTANRDSNLEMSFPCKPPRL